MPSDNALTFRRYLNAISRGDTKGARGLLDRDVEWGSASAPTPYFGHKGVEEFWSQWASGWKNFRAEPEQIVEGGEYLVAVVRTRGEGSVSGDEIERGTAVALAFRNGRIAWVRIYPTHSDALKAVGLQEH
jgi:ketosteroid isomerase-like protein